MRAKVVFGLLAAVSLLGACSNSGTSTPTSVSRTSSVSTTSSTQATTSTVPPTTSSTAWSPTANAPSDYTAVELVIRAWSKGDHALANTVATPAAQAQLFALPYPAGELQGRGCSVVSPATCTYRNLRTNEIYEFGMNDSPRGWYVTGVVLEK